MKTALVPFKTWYAWTNGERAQFVADCKARGLQLVIDMMPMPDDSKDIDEYNEEMSLGGRPFKTH